MSSLIYILRHWFVWSKNSVGLFKLHQIMLIPSLMIIYTLVQYLQWKVNWYLRWQITENDNVSFSFTECFYCFKQLLVRQLTVQIYDKTIITKGINLIKMCPKTLQKWQIGIFSFKTFVTFSSTNKKMTNISFSSRSI